MHKVNVKVAVNWILVSLGSYCLAATFAYARLWFELVSWGALRQWGMKEGNFACVTTAHGEEHFFYHNSDMV